MKEEILLNINNSKELEKLFRSNRTNFKREFNSIYPELTNNVLADFWNERLNYETVSSISWGSRNELFFIIIASLTAGLIAKIPDFTNINADDFYQRNTGFIIFPLMTAYFIWKKNIDSKKILIIVSASLVSLLFINYLPFKSNGDTLFLSSIHLPLFLWAILGFTFISKDLKGYQTRLGFLRYNGDLVVLASLILISGMLLTGITVGLFSLIGFEIFDFYFEYIVVLGLVASPIVATYITQTNPQLVNKVSPVIAKIFSPLVLITLVTYLIAIPFSSKNPFNDREFLLTFNFLLIGVMTIILFSVAESSKEEKNKISYIILTLLSIVTVLVNGIALSAILIRIAEWGVTPNRLAVLGANILMLINLVLITKQLLQAVIRKNDLKGVEISISTFLPVYSLWTIVVVFIFPLIFGLK